MPSPAAPITDNPSTDNASTDNPSTDRPIRPASTPHLKRVHATGQWQGALRTRLAVRDFEPFHTGEPVAAGGDGSAPTPMELVSAALAGCLAVVIETVAGERGLHLATLDLAVDGAIDVRGFQGTAPVSPHFQSLTVTIALDLRDDHDADGALLAELRADVERRCPALTLVRDAGVPAAVDWTITTGGRS